MVIILQFPGSFISHIFLPADRLGFLRSCHYATVVVREHGHGAATEKIEKNKKHNIKDVENFMKKTNSSFDIPTGRYNIYS